MPCRRCCLLCAGSFWLIELIFKLNDVLLCLRAAFACVAFASSAAAAAASGPMMDAACRCSFDVSVSRSR